MKSFLNELDDNISFVIFYGSQLGQAKSIAEGLVDVAEHEYDFKTKCFELNVVKDVNDLNKLPCPIVIVTSTTGDGEPPENADKFWRKIRKRGLPSTLLQPVKFTLLGLGDTNYNDFCNCGKVINNRLLELGAHTFYSPAWADDAVGLELVIDNWIDNLWPSLESLIRPNSAITPKMEKPGLTVPSCPTISLKLEWLDDGAGDLTTASSDIDLCKPLAPYPLIEGDPVPVILRKARILNRTGAPKTALELTVEFKEKPFQFQPGDAVNIVCPNSSAEVDQLFERLELKEKAEKTLQLCLKEGSKGKIPAFLPATIKVRSAFLFYLDIRGCPRKNFLRLLAEFTSDPDEKSTLLNLCSRQGAAHFEETVRFAALSLLDLLLTFPSCKPPLEALLEHLPRLAPRAYSISSSPLVNDNEFTFAFNVVVIPKEKGRRYERLGVCTGWLYNKCKTLLGNSVIGELDDAMKNLFIDKESCTESISSHQEIILYRRKNQTFRLPESHATPVIMVGPGTGVAPFLGFIQHRKKLKEMDGNASSGEMTLYFGCRYKEKDFLYEKELKSMEENCALTKFYPVFSRDDPEAKVKYVQHKMEEHKEDVIKTLFENGGYLYVCGDARNMAKDVRDTLQKCVQTVKEITDVEAKTLVTELTTQKRYLQDVWT